MDTGTVLEIIKMLDRRITVKTEQATAKGFNFDTPSITELKNFRDQLQLYIEMQLSSAECNTGE